jgi:hypothetical protein
MRCPGSVALEAPLPDTSSKFADEGTAAHELASMALGSKTDAHGYIGRIIKAGEREFAVDEAMANHVQVYIDNVREYAIDAELLIEQRVQFSEHIGVPDSFGTSDAVILRNDELQVHDLKYGMGVKVDAEANEQLMLYALGALAEFGMLGDFQRVVMVIHQPRLAHVSEWSCSVEDLLTFAGVAREQAARAMHCVNVEAPQAKDLVPGEKQCRFCKAKATCPALVTQVMGDFKAEPEPGAATGADQLARLLANADLYDAWLKAIRAEAERRMLAGDDVPGFKLVEGRRGARKWTSEAEAEAALKAMRIKHDQMYDYSVISPTSAEKLAKAEVLGERQWSRLQSLITQSEGKPSVAPASDKRPALVVTAAADDFADIAG